MEGTQLGGRPMIDDRAERSEVVLNEAPKSENKIRRIEIEELSKGYVIRVGCQAFAISTKAELTTKLTEYINEPAKTEAKWFNGELF